MPCPEGRPFSNNHASFNPLQSQGSSPIKTSDDPSRKILYDQSMNTASKLIPNKTEDTTTLPLVRFIRKVYDNDKRLS